MKNDENVLYNPENPSSSSVKFGDIVKYITDRAEKELIKRLEDKYPDLKINNED